MNIKYWYKSLAILEDGDGIIKYDNYLFHISEYDATALLNTQFDIITNIYMDSISFQYSDSDWVYHIKLKSDIKTTLI